jgi:D-lyxose ketol-isomerase
MIRRSQVRKIQERTAAMMEQAHIVLTPSEKANIEVAEYGLDDFDRQGLELVVYVNTDRYCAKEMTLFPGQTCPEHRHPSVGGKPGKMETFRCRWGRVWLYVEGEPVSHPQATVPKGNRAASRLPVHHPSEHSPLVPGRSRGCDRLRILQHE